MLLKQKKQKNGGEQQNRRNGGKRRAEERGDKQRREKGKPMCTAGRSMSGFSIKAPYSKILTISS